MSINARKFAGDYPNNSDRAEWAENALAVFCEETGLDPEVERREVVSDLICNLGHYCDQHGLEFLELASHAIGLWDVEKRDPAVRPLVCSSVTAYFNRLPWNYSMCGVHCHRQ